MSALTAARSGVYIMNPAGTTWSEGLMGEGTIYGGSLVTITASGCCVAGTDTDGETFAGMATETVTADADGSETISLLLGGAIINIGFSGTATQATVGDLVYVVDGQTVAVAATTTNDVLCGKVTKFLSATEVEIELITSGA